jgi:uncharacterized protein (TIGR02421 family)
VSKPVSISDRLIATIRQRLAANQPVRRTLPDRGRLHIDRQLPFLVVYRRRRAGVDEGAASLVWGEASYLIAPHGTKHSRKISALIDAISGDMVEIFGGFLVVEIWSAPAPPSVPNELGELPKPAFRVVVPRRDQDSASVGALVERLRKVRIQGRRAEVELVPGGRLSPPGEPRLNRRFGSADSPVRLIGLEVRPVYRNEDTGELFPEVRRSLHRQLSVALQQAAYQFAIHQTTHRPRHYQALGRRAMVKAVTDVDARLAEIAGAFDLLLMVSPVNADREYRSFRRNGEQRPPRFRYRPLDVDPDLLKRKLYNIAIERVEDPTLAAIFRDKRRELSLQLDLLSDLGTPRFLHTAVALYGSVDPTTVGEALRVLERWQVNETRAARTVGAGSFAAAAQREIARYQSAYPALEARVEIRDDINSLMVSQGHLLIGSKMRIPAHRVDALVQHEVGTHVVTYWNGHAQKLQLLSKGLARHEELQEGLAVLAEYLVAGLTPARLRIVAGRVVAARSVADGAEFLDTYRQLRTDHGFGSRTAFQIATRLHRGGGFVKDAIYFRGLHAVIGYLAEGGRLDTLLVGKISVEQVPVIEELQRRGVLTTPPLRPAYLDDPDTHYQLERLRGGTDIASLAATP